MNLAGWLNNTNSYMVNLHILVAQLCPNMMLVNPQDFFFFF